MASSDLTKQFDSDSLGRINKYQTYLDDDKHLKINISLINGFVNPTALRHVVASHYNPSEHSASVLDIQNVSIFIRFCIFPSSPGLQ
jgi:hypothetical protein